jgi:plastocyanin
MDTMNGQNVSSKALILGIVGLLVVAVVLGVLIFKPKLPTSLTDNNQNNNNQPQASNNAVPARALTADEKKLLETVPDQDATKAEMEAHNVLAAKLAVVATEVDITDCISRPLVVKVKDGSSLTFKNNGSQEKTVAFGSGTAVKIAAGKNYVKKIDFKGGAGLYGYGCAATFKDIKTTSGFVLVF